MPADTPLFDIAAPDGVCNRCKDLGLWITALGDVQPCPNVASGAEHNEPSASARMIHRAIELLCERNTRVEPRAFEIAKTLSYFSSDTPCSRDDLLKMYFSYLPMTKANQLRKFHAVIEELRRIWLLPVGSRKDSPAGYWIITDQDDFKEWFSRTRSAPMTQLQTIHRVAKRNFPIFAQQLEIDFSGDNEPPPTAVAA